MEQRKSLFIENLDKCYKVVLQSSAKGITAKEIAKVLNVHRTTVHSYLSTLQMQGKVYSEKGLWFPKNEKVETVRDITSEIRTEIEKIKEEYVEGQIDKAFRRLVLLVDTRIANLNLPQEAKNEIQTLKDKHNNKIKEILKWHMLILPNKQQETIRQKIKSDTILDFLNWFEKAQKAEEFWRSL
jgi:predicted transcriptional regulator